MASPFHVTRFLVPACLLALPLLQACAAEEPEEAEVPPPALEAPAASLPAATGAEVPADLRSAHEQYLAAWNAEDPAAVAAFFEEGATVQTGDSTYTGRAAIQDRWLARNLPVVNDLQIAPERFQQNGAEIVEEGRYTFQATPPQGETETVRGRYTSSWTRTPEGAWKVRRATIQPDAPQS